MVWQDVQLSTKKNVPARASNQSPISSWAILGTFFVKGCLVYYNVIVIFMI